LWIAFHASRKLGRAVRFEKRRTRREVLVARGRYLYAPLSGRPRDGEEVVELYDADPPPGSSEPMRTRSALSDMYDAIAAKASRPVVDETGETARDVSWRDHFYTRSVDALIRNVSAQTGLSFTRQTRDWDTWWMVDDAGSD